ncbi:MAG: hypothetical protein ACOYL7_06605, partial [Caldilinea sp.]
MATQIQSQLEATDQFGSGSGRTVEVDGSDNLVITYAAKDGDVQDIQLTDTSNDNYFTVGAVAVSRDAITQTQEMFDNNGRFLRSGNLVIEHVDTDNTAASLEIKATFVTPDNNSVNLTGTFDKTEGTVTFLARDGINSTVISDNLTYLLKDSTGAPFIDSVATKDLETRNFKLTVDVAGT